MSRVSSHLLRATLNRALADRIFLLLRKNNTNENGGEQWTFLQGPVKTSDKTLRSCSERVAKVKKKKRSEYNCWICLLWPFLWLICLGDRTWSPKQQEALSLVYQKTKQPITSDSATSPHRTFFKNPSRSLVLIIGMWVMRQLDGIGLYTRFVCVLICYFWGNMMQRWATLLRLPQSTLNKNCCGGRELKQFGPKDDEQQKRGAFGCRTFFMRAQVCIRVPTSRLVCSFSYLSCMSYSCTIYEECSSGSICDGEGLLLSLFDHTRCNTYTLESRVASLLLFAVKNSICLCVVICRIHWSNPILDTLNELEKTCPSLIVLVFTLVLLVTSV